jgi:serine phosphatase RsbU (regulator of sigma subunit)/anti-sigma regulatory factor (Ser/Thr protein kinase)
VVDGLIKARAAAPPDRGAPTPTAPLAGAAEHAATSILLVDDDRDTLRALQAVLAPLHQRLVAVSSGEEALRRLLHEEFALILLDVRMPGIDGLETAHYIQTRARTHHIPIIFLTAQPQDVEQVFHAYAAGAVDYVVKPVDPHVLRSKARVFVELARERGERVREAQARAAAEAIAGALQRRLLPERLPHVPGMALAARYRAGERGARVGGDWYDAIALPGERVGLAIGDVVGHGVRAATLMGELRSALRAYALIETQSPGAVLTRLNELVVRTYGRRMVATVLYMVIDADGEGARFATAGHLPPLLYSAVEGVRQLAHAPLPPLGVATHPFLDSELQLSTGATVLLYTDGLVERRDEVIDVGLARLHDALAGGPADLDELCSHILAATLGGVHPQDDAALLALRLLPQSGERLDLELAAEPESVPLARHRLVRWLERTGEGNGEGSDDIFALELAVGEACANAVEHAYGPSGERTFFVHAERERHGRAVAVHVADSGHWRPRRGSQRGLGLQMIEQLMDTVDIQQTPAGTTVCMRRAASEELPR